jgi:hypothetical protein
MFDMGLNLPLEVPDEISGDVRYLVATIHTWEREHSYCSLYIFLPFCSHLLLFGLKFCEWYGQVM